MHNMHAETHPCWNLTSKVVLFSFIACRMDTNNVLHKCEVLVCVMLNQLSVMRGLNITTKKQAWVHTVRRLQVNVKTDWVNIYAAKEVKDSGNSVHIKYSNTMSACFHKYAEILVNHDTRQRDPGCQVIEVNYLPAVKIQQWLVQNE